MIDYLTKEGLAKMQADLNKFVSEHVGTHRGMHDYDKMVKNVTNDPEYRAQVADKVINLLKYFQENDYSDIQQLNICCGFVAIQMERTKEITPKELHWVLNRFDSFRAALIAKDYEEYLKKKESN